MAISSIGIGSGLDVESIVTQMVALEKSPIKTLAAKADVITSKISTYADIKSKVDALNAAVGKLSRDSGWNGVNIASSTSAASGVMTGIAAPGSYNLDVLQLASSQTTVSSKLDAGAKMGSVGTFKFSVGTLEPKNFEVAIGANDTLETVAANINSGTGGTLIASVITDSQGKQQLMIRAKNTGTEGAFTLAVEPVKDGAIAAGSALAALAAPATGTKGQPGYVAGGMEVSQVAVDAKIKLNGVEIESSSNTFAKTIPGMSISVSSVTTGALLTVSEDTSAMQKNIQEFVDAYNALNTLLTDSTKYDKEADVAGILQGDSSSVSLLNAVRMLTQGSATNSTGSFKRLSDIGIQMLQGGALSLDATKLAASLKDTSSLKNLFAAKSDAQGQGGGLAVNFKTFTDGLLAWEGALNNKTDSLEKQKEKNSDDQDKVTKRANALETRLRAQYTALDVKMSSLTALNSYVSQMVTSWNKSSD